MACWRALRTFQNLNPSALRWGRWVTGGGASLHPCTNHPVSSVDCERDSSSINRAMGTPSSNDFIGLKPHETHVHSSVDSLVSSGWEWSEDMLEHRWPGNQRARFRESLRAILSEPSDNQLDSQAGGQLWQQWSCVHTKSVEDFPSE